MTAAWWQQPMWACEVRRLPDRDAWGVWLWGHGEPCRLQGDRVAFNPEVDPAEPPPMLVITGIEAKTGLFRALVAAMKEAGFDAPRPEPLPEPERTGEQVM